ncbi:MAG: hypothetical protein ACHQZR_03785 [Candidatus Limnocylindrales bacterium]
MSGSQPPMAHRWTFLASEAASVGTYPAPSGTGRSSVVVAVCNGCGLIRAEVLVRDQDRWIDLRGECSGVPGGDKAPASPRSG